jgi:cell division protein FtsX
MTAMGIGVREGASVPAVGDRLGEQLGLAVGSFDRPTVVANYARVRGAPWIVVALLAVLIVLTVTNLVVVTLNRRGRDIAVLRALGADRRWISRVEHWHAVAVGLTVGLLSAVLGVAAGRLLFRTRVADRIGVSDDTLVPLLWLGAGVVALVLVTDLVAQVTIRWRHAGVARRLAVE